MIIKHPMVLAIGEKEFKEGLDKLPEYYTLEYEGNMKPIGMQMIWEARHVEPPEYNTTKEQLDALSRLGVEMFETWKLGKSRQEVVKDFLPQLLFLIASVEAQPEQKD